VSDGPWLLVGPANVLAINGMGSTANAKDQIFFNKGSPYEIKGRVKIAGNAKNEHTCST
jgi:hypothetical protein